MNVFTEEADVRKTIFFAADRAFSIAYGLAVSSLLQNADKTTVYDVHVLDDGIDDVIKKQVDSLHAQYEFTLTYHDVSDVLSGVAETAFFSRVACARFLIPDLLPDLEEGKVFYSDVDVLIKDDLSRVFLIDMKGMPLAAVQALNLTASDNRTYLTRLQKVYDVDFFKQETPYYQSGALLFDIAAWRRSGFKDRILGMCSQELPPEVSMPDQDIMNIVCCGNIFNLPVEYCIIPNFSHRYICNYDKTYTGLITYSEDELRKAYESPAIIHYAAEKPLVYCEVTHPLEKEFVNFWAQSLWKNRIPFFSKRLLTTPSRSDVSLKDNRDKTLTVVIQTNHLLSNNISSCFVRTMDSLMSQTWPFIEILVLDNQSEDGTRDLLDKYAEKNILRYISSADEENIWELASSASCGKYVYFMHFVQPLPSRNYVENLYHVLEGVTFGQMDTICCESSVLFLKRDRLMIMENHQSLKNVHDGSDVQAGNNNFPCVTLESILDQQIKNNIKAQQNLQRQKDLTAKYADALASMYLHLKLRLCLYRILAALTHGKLKKRFAEQKKKYKERLKMCGR